MKDDKKPFRFYADQRNMFNCIIWSIVKARDDPNYIAGFSKWKKEHPMKERDISKDA
jgi:hypothetical protein